MQCCHMYIPVLIIGTGIAGLSLGYKLEQLGIGHLIITKTCSPFQANTSIAPANTRILRNADYPEEIERIAQFCGIPIQTLDNIYRRQDEIKKLYKNLGIVCKETNIGIMPDCDTRGGLEISKRIAAKLSNIRTDLECIEIKSDEKGVSCLIYDHKTSEIFSISCSVLCVATGGFSSLFPRNDNVNTANGNGIAMLKLAGCKTRFLSTVMIHPFGVKGGKLFLEGDVVSKCKSILCKQDDRYYLVEIPEELMNKVKANQYHDSDSFSKLAEIFSDREIFLEFVDGNMTPICNTFHYTSGGIVTDANFKATDNIFASGEIAADGNKGIGRIPGHPFSLGIISGDIIAEQIKNHCFRPFQYAHDTVIRSKLEENKPADTSNEKSELDKVIQKLAVRLEKRISIKDSLYQSVCDLEVRLNEKIFDITSLKEYYRAYLVKEIIEDTARTNNSI